MAPMSNRVNPGGTRKNFDRDACVTFLGLKFDKLLFLGLLKMRVILRVEKISNNFWGLTRSLHYFLGC